ncbi:hypothetical protein [Streptomyces jumonjinensis]|uniref:hypothetical protein n=1 Tax=Streptomyces jumonjinensis TaxID=1945 RepID=UPI00378F5ACA
MRRGRTATAIGSAAGGSTAGVRALGAGIVLCISCALAQAPAPAGATSRLAAYQTDPGAKTVRGSSSAGVAGPRLKPGTYLDTISAGERKFYRVELDATANAYVSAVLAPPAGGEVGAADGIRVSLRSPDGAECSDSNDITFGGTTPLPTADYSTRRIGTGRECQEAGEYLYSVEWIGPGGGSGSGGGSGAEDWTVELKYMTEPGLRSGTAEPTAPASWHAHSPDHVTGDPRRVTGGSGFNDAGTIGHGVWQDTLHPGETRFYRVPLDWEQRLFLDAEFGGPTSPKPSAVRDGLRVTAFNTARGFVRDSVTPYRGRPAKVSFNTVRAAFANRTSDQDGTSAMRFSGWYYVRVTLDRQVSQALPVTLRAEIEGEPGKPPAYDGDPLAEGFGVTEEDREAALPGRADDDDARETLLTAVGYTGIGLGSLLLLGLLGWTARARLGRGRRRGRHASPAPTRESRAH